MEEWTAEALAKSSGASMGLDLGWWWESLAVDSRNELVVAMAPGMVNTAVAAVAHPAVVEPGTGPKADAKGRYRHLRSPPHSTNLKPRGPGDRTMADLRRSCSYSQATPDSPGSPPYCGPHSGMGSTCRGQGPPRMPAMR